MHPRLLQQSHGGRFRSPQSRREVSKHPETLSPDSFSPPRPLRTRVPPRKRTVDQPTCSAWTVAPRAGPHGIRCLFLSAELLGIRDLSRPDSGDPVACQPREVPVFWPSPLTGLEAISACSTSGPEKVVAPTQGGLSFLKLRCSDLRDKVR